MSGWATRPTMNQPSVLHHSNVISLVSYTRDHSWVNTFKYLFKLLLLLISHLCNLFPSPLASLTLLCLGLAIAQSTRPHNGRYRQHHLPYPLGYRMVRLYVFVFLPQSLIAPLHSPHSSQSYVLALKVLRIFRCSTPTRLFCFALLLSVQ